MKTKSLLSVFATTMVLGLANPAFAVITISLQNYNLLPDTANQDIQVLYGNDGAAEGISGMTVALSIGGGDPPGGVEAPNFSGASAGSGSPLNGITPSTLFSGQNQSTQVTFEVPDIPAGAPLSTVDLVGENNLNFFTLTIDTSGFFGGTYDIEWVPGSSSFPDEDNAQAFTPVFQNGTLTVVPEPHEYAMVAGLGLLGWAMIRKRKTSALKA